jgi:hypothetical protein
VNRRTGIAVPVLSCCEFTEVAGRDWCYVVIQPKDDATDASAIDGDVKLHVIS